MINANTKKKISRLVLKTNLSFKNKKSNVSPNSLSTKSNENLASRASPEKTLFSSIDKLNHRKKTDLKALDRSYDPPPNFEKIVTVLNKKICRAMSRTKNNYFNECKYSLEKLGSLNHPISKLLKNIESGYNQEITKLKTLSMLSCKCDKKPDIKPQKTQKKTLNSYLLRTSTKSSSPKLNHIQLKPKNTNPSITISSTSVPKLKIKKIAKLKQSPSRNIPNSPDLFFFQDYHDEFMSKLSEFSESWRLKLLQRR